MSFFHKQGPKRSKLICVKIFSFDDDGKFLNEFKMTFRDDKFTKEFNETPITKEKFLSLIYSYDQRCHEMIRNSTNYIYTTTLNRTLVEVLYKVNNEKKGTEFNEKIKQMFNSEKS